MNSAARLALLLGAACALLAGCGRPERISHGLFDDVALYRPEGEPQQFVLFFSGDDGWSRNSARIARELVAQGAMVAGIDTRRLFARLEASGGTCTFPDGDLENLSHYLQGYARLQSYHTPLLVGYSAGATFAYALLAQTRRDLFGGAVTLAFCEDLDLTVPLCPGEGAHFRRRADGKVMDLLPTSTSLKWVELHGVEDEMCPVDKAQAFVARVPDARFVALREVAHRFAGDGEWRSELIGAYDELARSNAPAVAPIEGLSGLPLIDVPALPGSPSTDTFALLLSGDGGWAGLDKQVAAALAARGVVVVGFDSLRYFWSERTPETLTRDVERILRHYAGHLNRSRAVLIGYSQGANVLPFVINRLSGAARDMLSHTVLVGLEERASWEFHLDNWLGRTRESVPVKPEADRLLAARTLCVYGTKETTSLCPQLSSTAVAAVQLPGDHHLDGDYDRLAAVILEHILPGVPAARAGPNAAIP